MGERPRTYKTEGIILRRRNLGEADSIFTVYADREGKFDAIAKGVRKARSRMRGHLEPLTRTRMMLARGRSLDVFTQAETVAPYRALRENLERGAAAMYCAELVDRFTAEHVEHPGLYELILDVFDALEAGAAPHVVRYFEANLLSHMGYELQLDACAVCGNRLPEEDTLLSAAAGGLVCYGCRAVAGGGRLVGVRGVKVLRYARGATLEAFAAVRVDGDLDQELQSALAEVIRYVLDREPTTRRYLAQVTALGARHAPETPPPYNQDSNLAPS
ncbi:MAG TPA: DNA repair protein RecO [Tepidiformaceae bacterium]|nr:DNA repair protein RecO [Tepidiformaceae bacterium]